LDFICGCIIPHKQRFCFYLQKGVRCFETLQTLVTKGPIMLSNLVLFICFHSMQLITPSRFSLIWIVTSLTSTVNVAWKSNLE
jgi:hypothetical protein